MSQFSFIVTPSPAGPLCEKVIISTTAKFISKITHQSIKIKSKPDNISSIVQKSQTHLQTTQEKYLQKAKIQKKKLENQLITLDQNIMLLSPSKKTKPVQFNKQEDEKKKREFKQLKLKIDIQKKARRKYLNSLRKKQNEKLLKQAQLNKKLQQQLLQKQKEQKNRLLQQRHQKAIQRRQQIQQRKQLLKIAPKQKPTFQKLEDNYKLNIEMPQLQRRKAELAKKRLQFQSISQQQIQEHAKRHKQLSADLERQRKRNQLQRSLQITEKHPTSQFMQDYLLRQQKLQQEKEMKAKRIGELKDKQRRYSELIKEMIVPRIDPRKVAEIQSLKSKTNQQKKPIQSQPRSHTVIRRPPLKRPVKTSLPPPQQKIKPVVSDYLSEQREHRSKLQAKLLSSYQKPSLSVRESGDKKQQADKLEALSRKHELLARAVSPSDPMALEINQQADDLLLKSIQAKLQLLD